jgi:glutamate synthase (NADPH) small chain
MGDPRGFMKHPRVEPIRLPVEERIKHYREFERRPDEKHLRDQGARCMDCGVPFCHGPTGCPLGNLIPVWNDHVYRDEWREAIDALHATNNFPEFTGRVCPAPCETACVLGINEPPVAIKQIEVSIIDRAFQEGWIRPEPPATRTGKKVAVVGSGPAGLACAQQLNRAGHTVTVFERADRVGGLLTYGIPDFKMEKSHVDRRVDQMKAEGVVFRTNANVGVNVDASELMKEFDAIVLCGGSTVPRDLPIPGRDLDGIEFAMDFLPQQNRRVAGLPVSEKEILATGKHVVVIGGGDTGSDCIGTSVRQGARSVIQFELLPEPPAGRTEAFPWPYWPMIKRTSSSQAEAAKVARGERIYSINTKKFTGENGKVKKLHAVRLEWAPAENGGHPQMREIPGSETEFECDLALLAMGFLHPQHEGMLKSLGVELDRRGNVSTSESKYQTSIDKVFAAGDMRRGQSLVVWAIAEGRNAAYDVDEYLMGESLLPRAHPR